MDIQTMAEDGTWPTVERSLAGMDHPLLHAILDYWDELRGTRAIPRRREIDPVLLPRPSLSHLFLMHVEGRYFRYDLVGTALELQFGMSMAGRLSEELPFEPDRNSIFSQHQVTAETQHPTYREHDLVDREKKLVHCCRLLLPLSADGTTVTDLFGIWLFANRPPGGAGTAAGFARR